MKNPSHHRLAKLSIGVLACSFFGAISFWQRERVGSVFPSIGSALQSLHDSILPASPKNNVAANPSGETTTASGQPQSPMALPSGDTGVQPPPSDVPSDDQLSNSSAQNDPNAARKTPAQMRLRGEAITRLKHDKKALGEAFLDLAADLTKENWVEAFEGVAPVYGKGLLPPNAWENMLRKMGELVGVDAIKKFQPSDFLMDYESYGSRFAMEGWARSNPEEARKYLEGLPDGRYKDGLAMGLFPTLVNVDRAGLESLFKTLPESYYPQIATALREKVRWEQPQGIPAVQNWLVAAEASYGKDSSAYRAIDQAAQIDLLEHAEYDKNFTLAAQTTSALFEQPDTATDRVLDMSLRVLSLSQPALAFQYLERTMPQRPGLEKNIPAMIERWANTDLGGPGDWLNAHTASPVYTTTVKAYAKVLAKEDPAAAQVWLNLVQAKNLPR